MRIDWLILLSIHMILFYVCYTDIRWRKITNRASLLLCLLSLLLGFLRPEGPSLIVPAIMFFGGFLISTLGLMGAGDVKLACALAVALLPEEIGRFLLLTGMAGIPLSIVIFIYYRMFRRQDKVTVPYGVAIASGYGLLWLFQSSFSLL